MIFKKFDNARIAMNNLTDNGIDYSVFHLSNGKTVVSLRIRPTMRAADLPLALSKFNKICKAANH